MGTGTGIWAIDFADEFPSAIVIGTDLSPIQPTWVPPNCKFIVDDLENEWLYNSSEAFDYIHGRALGGSIKDWKSLYQQIFKHLKPGGYVEIQEYEKLESDDDPEFKNAPSAARWQDLMGEASEKFGRRINVATEMKPLMIDVGFVDVTDEVRPVCSPSLLLSVHSS